MTHQTNVDVAVEQIEELIWELTQDESVTSLIADKVRELIADLKASGQLIDLP